MGKSDFGTIIQIGDCLVSEEVVTEYFACDYPKCGGCCCVVGDCGAPLREDELEPLEREYGNYSPLMTPQGRAAVDETGFFEIDRDGDLVTPTVRQRHKVEGIDYITGSGEGIGVPGLEECAYIRFEKNPSGGTSCLCSIEKAYFQGKSRFRKPLSCSLYPIRVSKLGNGTDALNFHRWTVCSDAMDKGRREGIRVYEFLKEPLTEAYGEDFYEALDAAARYVNAGNGTDDSEKK